MNKNLKKQYKINRINKYQIIKYKINNNKLKI